MKRFTGVASSDAWWLHRSKILWQRCGGKRVALSLIHICNSSAPGGKSSCPAATLLSFVQGKSPRRQSDDRGLERRGAGVRVSV